MKVHIIGGWSEGPRHEGHARRALERAGLEVTKRDYEADAIIAHSAGCYFLPGSQKQKLTMVIGPPDWPGKSIVWRTFQHAVAQVPRQIRNWGFGYWTWHRFWNIFYILIIPFRIRRILRSVGSTLLEQLEHSKVLIVRNRDDVFCGPAVKELAKKYKNTKFLQLPGLHDDFWKNPKPYVDLILKEL